MRSLAYRRHQWVRAKGRAVRQLQTIFATEPEWMTPKLVAGYAVDRVPCSCAMCGNPRHFTGEPTRQEIVSANGSKFW